MTKLITCFRLQQSDDGYHVFPPKRLWFTRAHHLVLRNLVLVDILVFGIQRSLLLLNGDKKFKVEVKKNHAKTVSQ